MKTIIATLVFASLIATSAIAKTEKGNTTHVDRSNIYQSDSLVARFNQIERMMIRFRRR
jgi:hypothetical protein